MQESAAFSPSCRILVGDHASNRAPRCCIPSRSSSRRSTQIAVQVEGHLDDRHLAELREHEAQMRAALKLLDRLIDGADQK
jgi:hypothetical protein